MEMSTNYMKLCNNREYYQSILSKYKLVETTHTIVGKNGQQTKYEYLGQDGYSGFVVTEVNNSLSTTFVIRGTGSIVDHIQDGEMSLGA